MLFLISLSLEPDVKKNLSQLDHAQSIGPEHTIEQNLLQLICSGGDFPE